MSFELALLRPEDAEGYAHLILAPFPSRVALEGRDRLVALGASSGGQPVGAAIATISSDRRRAFLVSLVVARTHRGQGLGASLVEDLERRLRDLGIAGLEVRYAAGKPSSAAFLRLLARREFRDLGPQTDLYRSSAVGIASLPWLASASLPASFEVFPLDGIAEPEREALAAARWYSPAWGPFPAALSGETEDPDPLSLGLRSGGEVVGWVLAKRPQPGLVIWNTFFVRRDLEASGVGLALLAEALRRAARDSSVTRHEIATDVRNAPMQTFLVRHVAPHVPPPTTTRLWRKALRPLRPTVARFSSMVDLLRTRARARPERETYTFLVEGDWDGPRESLTLGQLDERARQIATLLSADLAPGERALLLYPPGLEFLAAFFGCLYAGVVAVPAYPPGNRKHLPRIRSILSDSGAKVVLTSSATTERIRELLAEAESSLPIWASDTLIAGVETNLTERSPGLDEVALLQYTSGSTKSARGVVVTHGNLLHNLDTNRLAGDLRDATRFVSWLPHFHDFGLVAGLLLPLYVDGLLVQFAPAAFLQRPARWLEAMSKFRATFGSGPDFAYELCARRVPTEARVELDLSAWEIAVNGSEPVRSTTLDHFSEAFASCGLRPEVFMPCYGLAEATLTATWCPLSVPPPRVFVSAVALQRGLVRRVPPTVPAAREVVSAGRPLGEIEVLVVEPDSLRACAPDEVGEVWISGGGVATGYFGRTEATAAAFDAYLADGRGPYLRSGDLGFLDEGTLYVTGRIRDLIIVRGRNHHAEDIEATAEAAHPDLRPSSSAAFGVDRGQGEELILLAEVKRTRARDLDPAAIVAALRAEIVAVHDVELRGLVLLTPSAIPRTSSGKTQRSLARSLWQEGRLRGVRGEWSPTEADSGGSPGPGSPTGGEVEAWLSARVAGVLGRAPAPGESLTDLGLDSLGRIELITDLETWLGVSLPPTLVADAESLLALASAVEEFRRRD